MHKWYVIQVLSTHENKVKKALEDQKMLKGMSDFIAEVIVPTENVSEVKNGQQKIVTKRIWPGYILVKLILTDDSWQYVKNIQGVIEFLGGETPTALTEDEVAQILSELEKKKKSVTQKHKFKIGDNVKVVEGVFVNFMGTVMEVFPEKGTVSVNVSIFGRETRVDDLEFSQIEEVTEGSESTN
jgi:transcriptional antiterminator NusG